MSDNFWQDIHLTAKQLAYYEAFKRLEKAKIRSFCADKELEKEATIELHKIACRMKRLLNNERQKEIKKKVLTEHPELAAALEKENELRAFFAAERRQRKLLDKWKKKKEEENAQ